MMRCETGSRHHDRDADFVDASLAPVPPPVAAGRRPRSVACCVGFYGVDDSLASWLHGVAHRVALDAKAKAGRRRRHEARAAANSHSGPPEEITWRELR